MMKRKFASLHHVDRAAIAYMYSKYTPVFILTTGRSGSKFTAGLLNCSANVTAYHEPRPALQYFSDFAFHHQKEEQILTKMIDAARMELVLDVFIKDRIYVESNQCLTFFAPVISRLFKKSKFVHLVRHPGDFVRSALRKGWHKNDSIWESGRAKIVDKKKWEALNQIEKLSWLWDITNRFIENFFRQIERERTAFFKVEDLFQKVNSVNALCRFIGARKIPPDEILKIQGSRINEMIIHPHEPPTMKKTVDSPGYREWDVGTKDRLKGISGETALRYGYTL